MKATFLATFACQCAHCGDFLHLTTAGSSSVIGLTLSGAVLGVAAADLVAALLHALTTCKKTHSPRTASPWT